MPGTHQSFIDNFDFQDLDDPRLKTFREEYRIDEVVAAGKDDFEKMVLLSTWVHKQFGPFGRPSLDTENALEILPAIRAGNTFYCAHYCLVYIAAAQSLGWLVRQVSIKRDNEPTRQSNHNVPELWSEKFGKWIMIDPTPDYYITRDGVPLNCYEIGREWALSRGRDISIHRGIDGKVLAVSDLPYVYGHSVGYGDRVIETECMRTYLQLAFIPDSRFLGDIEGKSMEKWDDWENIETIIGEEIGWPEDTTTLAPYYKPYKEKT